MYSPPLSGVKPQQQDLCTSEGWSKVEGCALVICDHNWPSFWKTKEQNMKSWLIFSGCNSIYRYCTPPALLMAQQRNAPSAWHKLGHVTEVMQPYSTCWKFRTFHILSEWRLVPVEWSVAGEGGTAVMVHVVEDCWPPGCRTWSLQNWSCKERLCEQTDVFQLVALLQHILRNPSRAAARTERQR